MITKSFKDPSFHAIQERLIDPLGYCTLTCIYVWRVCLLHSYQIIDTIIERCSHVNFTLLWLKFKFMSQEKSNNQKRTCDVEKWWTSHQVIFLMTNDMCYQLPFLHPTESVVLLFLYAVIIHLAIFCRKNIMQILHSEIVRYKCNCRPSFIS